MYLIVGLGNPGTGYAKTRHNVGFMTVDLLADKLGIKVTKNKFNALIGEGNIDGEKVVLMKPMTYMNESGISVSSFVNFYNLPMENVIVICDDIDIPFGTIRIKKQGSAGTHNGLKSIIQRTGDKVFPRIKIAIGQSPDYMELKDFVLSTFTDKEKKILDKELSDSVDSVIEMVSKNVDSAMNKYNGKNHIEENA